MIDPAALLVLALEAVTDEDGPAKLLPSCRLVPAPVGLGVVPVPRPLDLVLAALPFVLRTEAPCHGCEQGLDRGDAWAGHQSVDIGGLQGQDRSAVVLGERVSERLVTSVFRRILSRMGDLWGAIVRILPTGFWGGTILATVCAALRWTGAATQIADPTHRGWASFGIRALLWLGLALMAVAVLKWVIEKLQLIWDAHQKASLERRRKDERGANAVANLAHLSAQTRAHLINRLRQGKRAFSSAWDHQDVVLDRNHILREPDGTLDSSVREFVPAIWEMREEILEHRAAFLQGRWPKNDN